MSKKQDFLAMCEDWFSKLHVYTDKLPARGSVAAALVVLERLKMRYDLSLDAHRAKGQAQIQGLTTTAVKKILAQHGETRVFSSEAGRTNRGGPGEVQTMLEFLAAFHLEEKSEEERNAVLDRFQEFLVGKVQEYHNRKRLEIDFDASMTTWTSIHGILQQAKATGKAGPVAQHLVGAKLELRFPDVSVVNEGYSAADVQTGRQGDFEIGDTAFHVTVAPTQALLDKCRNNLRRGLRVFLLVPDDMVMGARQNATIVAEGKIAVESIESFVANNIEELSAFSKSNLIGGFRRLLDAYNRRVDQVESDKSLLMEMPKALQ